MIEIRQPANGELLATLNVTPQNKIEEIFSSAKVAQKKWAKLPLSKRVGFLRRYKEILIDHKVELIDLIAKENGKPRFEALSNELIASLECIQFVIKNAAQVYSPKNIPMSLMLHRKSTLVYEPLGVIAVITPWNYPMLMPIGEIVMGLVAGNAVVFKPSEITPLIGLKMVELAHQAGLDPALLSCVIGDGKVGAAIIDQKPQKIFFTGSVATGKKIMAQAAQYLIPVNLELGGKDPMIVMEDADLDFASSAALWGGYSNSGQVCASIERLIVHESVAQEFKSKLTSKMNQLTQGDSSKGSYDLGAITFSKQKDIYEHQLEDAIAKGLKFELGGKLSQDRRFMKPTLVAGSGIEASEIYNEETFGPVIAMTTFRTTEEAIFKANASKYGLLCSIISADVSKALSMAHQIEAGSVLINETLYTAGLPETPWGGVKDTGFGKKHSALGMIEFVNTKHIHAPRLGKMFYKSLWWFPYTPNQMKMFEAGTEYYRESFVLRVKALFRVIVSMIQVLFKEKRL